MASSINISASASIKTGSGRALGIFVSAASSTPTLKVWDALTATGRVLIDTFTPVAGTFYPFSVASNLPGLDFTIGEYVSVSGTVSCTVVYE